MVNSALLSKKISNVRHNLSRIRTKAPLQLNDLKTDIDIQDIVLHNLQLAVQGCIDIAAHIVADQGWGVAGSINETFYILRDKKAISLEMMEKMVSMAGFRNILLHEYGISTRFFSGYKRFGGDWLGEQMFENVPPF